MTVPPRRTREMTLLSKERKLLMKRDRVAMERYLQLGPNFYPPTRKGSGDIAISLASVCPSVRPSVPP